MTRREILEAIKSNRKQSITSYFLAFEDRKYVVVRKCIVVRQLATTLNASLLSQYEVVLERLYNEEAIRLNKRKRAKSYLKKDFLIVILSNDDSLLFDNYK